jgi:hypothetical protein
LSLKEAIHLNDIDYQGGLMKALENYFFWAAKITQAGVDKMGLKVI